MKTFVIIKPDAVHKGLIGKIITRFEDAKFAIKRIEMCVQNDYWFNEMYNHLSGDVYDNTKIFMLSRPLIGLILEGHDTIKRVRLMVGNTNSSIAAPGTIRSDYGSYPTRFNCVHASDCVFAVGKEVRLFFGDDYGS